MNVERFAARIRTSQSKKLFDKSCRAIGFQKNVPESLAIFTFIPRSAQGELRFGVDKRDGGSQFVRSIGRKLRDALKGGFDPG